MSAAQREGNAIILLFLFLCGGGASTSVSSGGGGREEMAKRPLGDIVVAKVAKVHAVDGFKLPTVVEKEVQEVVACRRIS